MCFVSVKGSLSGSVEEKVFEGLAVGLMCVWLCWGVGVVG